MVSVKPGDEVWTMDVDDSREVVHHTEHLGHPSKT